MTSLQHSKLLTQIYTTIPKESRIRTSVHMLPPECEFDDGIYSNIVRSYILTALKKRRFCKKSTRHTGCFVPWGTPLTRIFTNINTRWRLCNIEGVQSPRAKIFEVLVIWGCRYNTRRGHIWGRGIRMSSRASKETYFCCTLKVAMHSTNSAQASSLPASSNFFSFVLLHLYSFETKIFICVSILGLPL